MIVIGEICAECYTVMEAYSSLEEAIAHVRERWGSDSDSLLIDEFLTNCYLFIDVGDSDVEDRFSFEIAGIVRAVMLPIASDPSQAITVYAEGRIERHRFWAEATDQAPATAGALLEGEGG
jgi:hypothetical protein